MTEIAPVYFSQTKFASFTRQLSFWGFKQLHRPGPDAGCYYHEKFLRGLPLLTMLMHRVPPKPSQGRPLPFAMGEPDFYGMDAIASGIGRSLSPVKARPAKAAAAAVTVHVPHKVVTADLLLKHSVAAMRTNMPLVHVGGDGTAAWNNLPLDRETLKMSAADFLAQSICMSGIPPTPFKTEQDPLHSGLGPLAWPFANRPSNRAANAYGIQDSRTNGFPQEPTSRATSDLVPSDELAVASMLSFRRRSSPPVAKCARIDGPNRGPSPAPDTSSDPAFQQHIVWCDLSSKQGPQAPGTGQEEDRGVAQEEYEGESSFEDDMKRYMDGFDQELW